MECSLAGWPSLDDFVWTGIGEINPSESLQQSNGTDNADSKSSSPSSVSMECEQYLELIDTVHASSVQKPSPLCLELNEKIQIPNILQAGALVTWRWDSMNATDLASVLDSTFSCQSVSSITTDDGEYTLYGDEPLMEPEKILSGDFDIFTGDSICDNSFITAAASNAGVLDDISRAGKDCVSRLSLQEQGTLTDIKSETVSDMKATENIIEPSALQEMQDNFLTQEKVQPSLAPVLDSKLESIEVSQLSLSNSEVLEDEMKLTNSNLLSLRPEEKRSYDIGGTDHCVSIDIKSKLFASKHHCTHPDMQQQQKVSQPVTDVGKNLEHGNQLCLSTRKIEEGKISATNSHRKAAVSSRLSSRKRINRAQASRARRHAAGQRHAEGRARKCALRKLMQMSSTSTNRTCYKSSQNFTTFIPMLHTSGHMTSPSLIGLTRAQPLERDEMKHEVPQSFVQKPLLLPVVVSAPTVTTVQAHHSNPFVGSSSMQVDPNLTLEHQQIKSHCQVPSESLDRSSVAVLNDAQVNTIQRPPRTSLMCGDQGQCFSSESSLDHLLLAEQLNQSVEKAPGTGFQSTVSGLRAVKGNEFASVTESLEAIVLNQLENVVTQLNGHARLSIRDSFYRLARSAKLRQTEAESCSISNINNAVETETNSLDRWIADLLFCRRPNLLKSKVCAPKSSEATCQALYRFPNANGNTHHWNACVNPQEIVLCTY